MSNHAGKMLMSVALASLILSSAQAGPPRFSGLRNTVSNKFSHSGSRPSISTMDAIKAQNFATDVKNKLKTHRFEPSTMDVIKAKNFASDVKDRVLNHRFEPSTMDVIKASNALGDLKSRVKSHLPH